MEFLNARARRPAARHAVTLSRRHFGVADTPVRYVIVIVPPPKLAITASGTKPCDQRSRYCATCRAPSRRTRSNAADAFSNSLRSASRLLRGVEERMLDRVARDLLQVAIAERIVARGAEIFVGEIDARDARVVGREHDRHARRPIGHQRMILAAHAEDHVVAGEVDLDRDLASGASRRAARCCAARRRARRRGRCAARPRSRPRRGCGRSGRPAAPARPTVRRRAARRARPWRESRSSPCGGDSPRARRDSPPARRN